MDNLTFKRVDNAMCRIYFAAADGSLFCFQPTFRASGFKLQACSSDGSPTHTVDHLNYRIDRLPPKESGPTANYFWTWHTAATKAQDVISISNLAHAHQEPADSLMD